MLSVELFNSFIDEKVPLGQMTSPAAVNQIYNIDLHNDTKMNYPDRIYSKD